KCWIARRRLIDWPMQKPEPPITIRPMAGESEAQVCARVMANSEPWLTLGRSYEHCLTALREPTRENYVACGRNELAGFIILALKGPFPGYLQTIAVTPEWRNRGVGRALMAFAEERIFRERPNVFLCVSSFNLSAQRFYERLGYAKVGELKNYVVNGHSEFLMRKTIGTLAEYEQRQTD